MSDMNINIMTVAKKCFFIYYEEEIAFNLAIQSAICVQAKVSVAMVVPLKI